MQFAFSGESSILWIQKEIALSTYLRNALLLSPVLIEFGTQLMPEFFILFF